MAGNDAFIDGASRTGSGVSGWPAGEHPARRASAKIATLALLARLVSIKSGVAAYGGQERTMSQHQELERP